MKVLSIGNSFSEDAQRYLHDIAKTNHCELMSCNLYIGGCTLKTHYLNMLDDEEAYEFQVNGQSTGLLTSIRRALKSNEWDIITLQQASPNSFCYETYVPYIEELVQYVKKYSPKAKIYIHQTWAYDEESPKIQRVGFENTDTMFKAVEATYNKIAELIQADGIILSGAAMFRAYQVKRGYVYRDGSHANSGFGRYLLALVWFYTLFGEVDEFKHISSFDIPVSDEEKELAYSLSKIG